MEDPREALRLEVKVDPEAWVEKYVAHRLRPGAKVLEAGCGPGLLLRQIGELDRSIRGTGIDISEERIRVAAQRHRDNPRLKFLRGDAQALEFSPNSFDFVYSRMLFQYLQDKEQALSELVRVCRPGGTVMVQDLDGQLLWHYPEDPKVQQTLEKVVNALAKTGFDPYVGRKLFRLAQLAGLEKIKVQVECYHLIAGEISPEIFKQWKLKLEIALPRIAQIFGSEQQAKTEADRFLEYLCRPDTLTYSTVFTVTGEKTFSLFGSSNSD